MYKNDIKFSLWCDFVERSFLEGEFGDLIEKKIVNAATSNPSIFKSAFLGSPAYAEDKAKLHGKSAKEMYEALAIGDIQRAAKKLLPLYEKGDDGFISIEVDPFLCDDAEATIEEGKRLFKAIGYPNVMIKVPATEEGFIAMEVLLSEGINVNATLIFSDIQTKYCLEAFTRANETLVKKGTKKLPQAVISIFVSRFDRKLDEHFKKIDFVLSRVGIMNAMRAYELIQNAQLPNVRALFASTGVKGDELSPDYYIRELLLPNSINTAPLGTIKAFIGSSKECESIELRSDWIENFFHSLAANGVDMNAVCDELMDEGLSAFKDAFVEILDELK
ncbi:transaldolase [Sulfurospirillum diekertiae]|uniref:Transaldolase n=1 Tax=Sulfurospirillum diekertiae TaxID=1854492 RepID=A0A6G9VSS8_9BACT|nr:transaldolase [Sulfurospirillum diekertiae]QIR76232.1 transaldolase [Sulfurospirillum diekertiae]QIR78861.1 transaldolase [Sulfurospirillum diekertiae]